MDSVLKSGDGEPNLGKPASRKNLFVGGVTTLARVVFLSFAAVLVTSVLAKTFLLSFFFIPSGSMEQTLHVGDRVMVSKLTPGLFDLRRGDVVVFSDPGGWLGHSSAARPGSIATFLPGASSTTGQSGQSVKPGQGATGNLVKRVIGLPGDRVVCCDAQGMIDVNGNVVEEKTYLAPGMEPSQTTFDVRVPPGRLWVMGDNRARSVDSRYHAEAAYGGFVPVDKVIGRVYAIVWPFSHLTRLKTSAATS
jgi:signal peptidase I